jgi:hypothetical protein
MAVATLRQGFRDARSLRPRSGPGSAPDSGRVPTTYHEIPSETAAARSIAEPIIQVSVIAANSITRSPTAPCPNNSSRRRR